MNTLPSVQEQKLIDTPFSEMTLLEKHELHKRNKLEVQKQQIAAKKALHLQHEKQLIKKSISISKQEAKRMNKKPKFVTIYKFECI